MGNRRHKKQKETTQNCGVIDGDTSIVNSNSIYAPSPKIHKTKKIRDLMVIPLRNKVYH